MTESRRIEGGDVWRFTIRLHGLDAQTLETLAAALAMAGFASVAIVDYFTPTIRVEFECPSETNWTRRLNEIVSAYCDFDYSAEWRSAAERAAETACAAS
jgi:hypothetical protein